MSIHNEKLEKYREFLKGKSASVLGVGISNIPLIGFLLDNGVKVTARDRRSEKELSENTSLEIEKLKSKGVSFVTGEAYLDGIREDIVFKSPGIRYDEKQILDAYKNGSLITSEMEAFISLCPSKIIAVTGSDGKTTTTTLVSELLKAAGKKVWLGGNIGHPLLSEIGNISPDDFTVLELSSFQLHTVNRFENKGLPFAKIEFPDVGIITNVTPNHLNWHIDMEEYANAKKAVFTNMKKGGLLVTNALCERTAEYEKQALKMGLETRMFSSDGSDTFISFKDDSIYFGKKKIIDRCDIMLPGKHNVENYMAAIGAVYDYVNIADIESVAKSFGGVEHRLELIREKDGVKFFNSSIDSTPTRTLAALSCFGSNYDGRIILILGGKDKNLDFTLLGETICRRHIKTFISHDTPEKKVEKSIRENENYDENKCRVTVCSCFDEAVKAAGESAGNDDVVLLSPALTSFDEFSNFEMRGKRFKSIVNSL